MFNRLDEERLCLWPPTKLLMNNLLNFWKEVMVFGGILPNHTLAGPFNVVGKTLHIILSGTPWRCIVVLNVAMWSHGSRIPSYESRVGILNLDGKGWLVMDAVKGESVLWMRSSTWLVLLMDSLISSMAFFFWSTSFSKCGTQRMMVPLDCSLPSALFSASPAYEFCPGPSVCHWRHCLCLLTSWVNSWFWCVRFAMAAATDCSNCWMDTGSKAVVSGVHG